VRLIGSLPCYNKVQSDRLPVISSLALGFQFDPSCALKGSVIRRLIGSHNCAGILDAIIASARG
jgi:hypothetical protein